MNLMEWSKSSVDYGHRLVSSALEGACEGEGEFLKDESLGPYLGESARHAFVRVASSAWNKINKTRDEHWFEKNPIDYA